MEFILLYMCTYMYDVIINMKKKDHLLRACSGRLATGVTSTTSSTPVTAVAVLGVFSSSVFLIFWPLIFFHYGRLPLIMLRDEHVAITMLLFLRSSGHNNGQVYITCTCTSYLYVYICTSYTYTAL